MLFRKRNWIAVVIALISSTAMLDKCNFLSNRCMHSVFTIKRLLQTFMIYIYVKINFQRG